MADCRSVAVSGTLEGFAIAEPSFLDTPDIMESVPPLQHKSARVYLAHAVIRMAGPQDPLDVFLLLV